MANLDTRYRQALMTWNGLNHNHSAYLPVYRFHDCEKILI